MKIVNLLNGISAVDKITNQGVEQLRKARGRASRAGHD